MSKELEEAQKQIDDLVEDIWRDAQGRVTKNLKHWKEIRRDQIINLKGVGWSIEVVKWELDPDTGASNAEIIDK